MSLGKGGRKKGEAYKASLWPAIDNFSSSEKIFFNILSARVRSHSWLTDIEAPTRKGFDDMILDYLRRYVQLSMYVHLWTVL